MFRHEKGVGIERNFSVGNGHAEKHRKGKGSQDNRNILYTRLVMFYKPKQSEGKVVNGDILCLIALEGNVDIVRNLCKFLNEALYFAIWH